jgi:hypothetical protein
MSQESAPRPEDPELAALRAEVVTLRKPSPPPGGPLALL